MQGRRRAVTTGRPCARLSILATGALLVALTAFSTSASAGAREQARRMHERLAGVPPTEAVLASMASDITLGNPESAAYRAMDNPSFYSVTLRNFAAPWTNRDQDVFVSLNDYTATVIGMIRDDKPFNTVLSANLVYTGSGGGLPPYSPSDNAHYEALDDQDADLMARLQETSQTAVSGLPDAATAGVLTTRAAAEAFFIAGTNRAMFRFTMMNHLCRDLDEVMDATLPPDRIRQDVSRSPGGDSRIFMNNCIGCHTGMDPLTQAFAYYTFDPAQGRLVYTAGSVHSKYFHNADTFRPGYVTPDDSWVNYWRMGQNALLGWDPDLPGEGSGAKSMGQELANSAAFARCQVEKVFRNVCLRSPVDGDDRMQVDSMVNSFRDGYRMKQVFAQSAAYCSGD